MMDMAVGLCVKGVSYTILGDSHVYGMLLDGELSTTDTHSAGISPSPSPIIGRQPWNNLLLRIRNYISSTVSI